MTQSVSVIIPTYNRPSTLKCAIDSALAQTYPPWEIIIVDDGSTDETAEMLQQCMSERPDWSSRVRYFYQQNQGQSAAFNAGIARAKGDWIAFLAHDDVWLPEKIELQFRAIHCFEERCGACFTNARFMNNPDIRKTQFQLDGVECEQPLGILPDAIKYLLNPHTIWVQTVLARAALIRRMGGFDPTLRFGEDGDFLFRLALITGFCFVSLPLTVIDRGGGRHVGHSELWEKQDYRLQHLQHRQEKWLDLSKGLPRDVRKIILRDMQSIHSAWANWYLQRKQYHSALQAISTAVKYHLSPSIAIKWALTRISPPLARSIMLRHQHGRVRRTKGIVWGSAKD